MTTAHAPQGKPWRATVAQWAPGLLVALAAGVATAHGIYEVAAAAGRPRRSRGCTR
ncbi:hypothetical protein ACFQV2_02270 [Actinokineospora soli]|uniref:Uncharacterized protein n=1 Tax=Actinokineospora soli TaxID=1048753 RepID=A0ABW2TI85_9PSEU